MSLEIQDCKDAKHAWCCLFAGVLYFLVKKPLWTVPILLIMLSGPTYIAFDYVTTYRAKIKEAVPASDAKPETFNFSLSEKAYAGNGYRCFTKDSIILSEVYIRGVLQRNVFYGCWDKSIEIYPIENTDRMIVYDRKLKIAFDMELPYFRAIRMKQMNSSK